MKARNQEGTAAPRPASLHLAILGAACAVAWFVAHAVPALFQLEFGDETEHIVAARMIVAGERLYSTIFANHGALPYVLSHVWLLLTGTRDLASHRLVALALFALCAGTVYASPALTQTRARLHALTLFLVPLGVLYAGIPLHMMMYQSMAGALLTIELALFAVPAVFGIAPPRWAAVAAGLAAAGAVFAAFSFAVAAALLAATIVALPPDAAGLRRRAISGFLAGALAGVAAVGAWITLYADWLGYFVYHYLFNMTIYMDVTQYSPFRPLRALGLLDFEADELIYTFAAAVCGVAAVVIVALSWPGTANRAALRWVVALAALAVGVAYLNPLGGNGFQASTWTAGTLGLGALALAKLLVPEPGAARFPRLRSAGAHACIAVLAGALVFVSQFARSSPHGIPLPELAGRRDGAVRPSEERVYRLIRELVPADERILAVPFAPEVYVYAERLPVSGNTFYQPIQARYATRPLWGYHIDLCKDVIERRPKVVYVSNPSSQWAWRFAQYAPCVQRQIDDNYVGLPWAPEFFVRRDVAAARPQIMKE